MQVERNKEMVLFLENLEKVRATAYAEELNVLRQRYQNSQDILSFLIEHGAGIEVEHTGIEATEGRNDSNSTSR